MAEEKNFYLTRLGLEKIEKEYEHLKQIKLAKTKGETPVVIHSEEVNPELIALQEDLELLDIKLSEMERILKNVRLIEQPTKTNRNTITLGATILADINGKTEELTIVGTLEASPEHGMISNESPVGQRLLGKKIGDRVAVDAGKRIFYKIKKISYNLS